MLYLRTTLLRILNFVSVPHVRAASHGGQKRALNSLELLLLKAVNSLGSVLATKFMPPVRANLSCLLSHP